MLATERPVLTLAELEAFDNSAPAGGRERRFLCPLPGCAGKARDAAHRSLCLSVATGAWCCHRCGASGVLREHWRPLGNQRAARRAAALRVFALPPPPPPPDLTWKPMVTQLQPAVHVPAATRYLAQRGITPEVAARGAVCFSPSWYGRPAVLFPIRDRAGALVAAHGRHIDGRIEPKCHTAGDLKLGVYGTPEALQGELLVITEAPLDALSLFQVGVSAIALCGTNAPSWLPQVAAFKRVALAFDADDAGDQAAEKLAPLLRSFGATVERWRPPAAAKDWNEVLIDQGKDALRTALPVYCPPSL